MASLALETHLSAALAQVLAQLQVRDLVQVGVVGAALALALALALVQVARAETFRPLSESKSLTMSDPDPEAADPEAGRQGVIQSLSVCSLSEH